MAAKASDPERIELAIQTIENLLDELPELARDWGQLSQDERLSWSLSWSNEMAKLRQLAEAEFVGQFERRHAQAVRELSERTVQSLSPVEQLELRRPAESVLSAGRVPS